MSIGVTLYRFKINLSDVDRGVYENLDFRLAMHPSETLPSVFTRALAFSLNTQPGLEFTPGGISVPEEPAIFAKDDRGQLSLWIEIGNPSARKLHKASKACPQVRVYTYKNPELILREGASENIHRSEHIEIFAFEPGFLEQLTEHSTKDVRWDVLHNDQQLTITSGELNAHTEVLKFKFS